MGTNLGRIGSQLRLAGAEYFLH